MQVALLMKFSKQVRNLLVSWGLHLRIEIVIILEVANTVLRRYMSVAASVDLHSVWTTCVRSEIRGLWAKGELEPQNGV